MGRQRDSAFWKVGRRSLLIVLLTLAVSGPARAGHIVSGMKESIARILCLSLFIFIAVPLTSFAEMQGGGEGKGGMMGEGMMGGMPMMQKMESMMMEMGPMMGMGMIGGPSGKGKAGGEAKAASRESEESAPGGADPHGH